MARATIPDALEMRRLKYAADVPLEAKDRVADALRAAGRRSEALLLYDGRADHPSLLEDLAWAVREGASFLRRTASSPTPLQRAYERAVQRICA